MSLFGVEAAEPSTADLAGLLAGPGQIVRMGGTARVSVVVDAQWRATVLVDEFAVRDLGTTVVSTVEGHFGVRTAYATALAPLATAWLRGAVKLPPRGFTLDGRRLRLWVIAAGYRDPTGYLLPMAPHDEAAWAPAGAALADIGLAGTLLGPRTGGPAYRIVGRRRIARLAEMIGEPPAASIGDCWP